MNKLKPKLVDYSLINPPAKKIKKIIVNHKDNFSFYVNLVGLSIIILSCIMLHDRYLNKEKTELEKQNQLINFHLYVKDNLKNNSL